MSRTVIVGGGIIGTSIAYHLQSLGQPVTLFEQGQLGSGTTSASVAQFTYHQDTPDKLSQQLRRRSWEWYEPRIESGPLSFEQTGTLHVARTAESLADIRSLYSQLASLGVETEWLHPEQLSRYNLSPTELAGGLFLPEDGILDPTEILQYHVNDNTALSVKTGVAVTNVDVTDGSVTGVETTDGYYDANVVINATGPWAPRLNEAVGVSLPLRHTRGPILVLQADNPLSLPLTFFEEGVYLRHEGTVQAFAGQMDTEYDNATQLDPDEARTPDESFSLAVADVVDRYVSGIDGFEIANQWLGLRTVTPDGFPIVGETQIDGYIVACGMNGFGITYAPAIGKLVAELLSGRLNSDMLSSLSPDRFET